ncbi:MAG: hypothetical protein Kow0090_19370 [Myxococcota bacterium]
MSQKPLLAYIAVILAILILLSCSSGRRYEYKEDAPFVGKESAFTKHEDGGVLEEKEPVGVEERIRNIEKIIESKFDFTPRWIEECWEIEKMPDIYGKWLIEHRHLGYKCPKKILMKDFEKVALVEQKGTCFRFKLTPMRLGVLCETDERLNTKCRGKLYGEGENPVGECEIKGKIVEGNWQAQYNCLLAGKEQCETYGTFTFIRKATKDDVFTD